MPGKMSSGKASVRKGTKPKPKKQQRPAKGLSKAMKDTQYGKKPWN